MIKEHQPQLPVPHRTIFLLSSGKPDSGEPQMSPASAGVMQSSSWHLGREKALSSLCHFLLTDTQIALLRSPWSPLGFIFWSVRLRQWWESLPAQPLHSLLPLFWRPKTPLHQCLVSREANLCHVQLLRCECSLVTTGKPRPS